VVKFYLVVLQAFQHGTNANFHKQLKGRV